MDAQLEPGHYVLAVSGGVDSMALLHLLANQPGFKLTVAHFDHGIRPDSAVDRQLVQQTAQGYGLPFVYAEGHLGPGTGEATARQARYQFLRQVLGASGAKALVTAHHQDDALETAILNMLRGTDRKGLSALRDQPLLRRPLLYLPKAEIINYARQQGLDWREDSTNQDLVYLRNYIRQRLVPRFNNEDRQRLWQLVQAMHQLNHQIDNLLANQLHLQPAAGQISRTWFNQLPHAVAREVLAAWLRAHGLAHFDRRLLERVVVAAKTNPAGKQVDVLDGWFIEVGRPNLALRYRER